MKPPPSTARAYRRLTWLMWRQRLNTILAGVFGLVMVMALWFGLQALPPQPRAKLEGTLIEIRRSSGDQPLDGRLIVRLDTGPEVTAAGGEEADLRKGDRVLLQQYQSIFPRQRTYRFIRYLESTERRE